jgi:hypothetical protein
MVKMVSVCISTLKQIISTAVKRRPHGQKIVFVGQKVLVPTQMAPQQVVPTACVVIKYVDMVITVFLLPAPVQVPSRAQQENITGLT